MTKAANKKQPYIPLYIGDWEQDTNCLSLQAEAAWLKIIFKMWKNGRSGRYKSSTNSLQNLWKTDTKGVQNIIHELSLNEVCNFEKERENEGKDHAGCEIYIFINRRMVKEAEISEIRTNAVQNRYKDDYKDDTNTLHPLDSDNDNTVSKINIEFEEFWKLYDKKTSPKESCQKKWEKLKDNERLLAMTYIPAYKISQPEKQFRKDPATFLNQKAWNNEIIYRNGTNPNLNGASQNGKSAAAHKLANRVIGVKSDQP